MPQTLYIGGLSFDMTEFELRELFAPAGNVQEVNLMQDKITGKSQGFGFVTMSSAEEATKAITRLNGHAVEGKPIVVSEAYLRQERPAIRLLPVISNK